MTYDELVAYLDSDSNEFGLDSVATHGFITATVVGLPLANWQSKLFEGNGSIDDAIVEALQEWQTLIANQLKAELPIELPFTDANTDGSDEVDFSPESDISAWAVGFMDAMYADGAEDWFADEDTEDDVAMLTLPMVVLSGMDEDDETLTDIRSDDGMLAQMANNIERNLTELFLLFHTND